jgi:hypothetical protein
VQFYTLRPLRLGGSFSGKYRSTAKATPARKQVGRDAQIGRGKTKTAYLVLRATTVASPASNDRGQALAAEVVDNA